MKHVLSTLAFAMLAVPAFAQDVDCDNAYTTADMRQCASLSLAAADAELNAQYRRAVAASREQDKYISAGEKPSEEMLREAQRAWIAFRDLTCDWESTLFRGGTQQSLLYISCLEAETVARTESLKAFADVQY